MGVDGFICFELSCWGSGWFSCSQRQLNYLVFSPIIWHWALPHEGYPRQKRDMRAKWEIYCDFLTNQLMASTIFYHLTITTLLIIVRMTSPYLWYCRTITYLIRDKILDRVNTRAKIESWTVSNLCINCKHSACLYHLGSMQL